MIQRFSAYSFLLILACLLLAGVVRVMTSPLESDSSWFNGKATLKLEKSFEKNLSFEPYTKTLWGVLNYGLFKTTGKGAVVGEDGWFYTAEEFEITPDFDKNIAANWAYVQKIKQQLTEKNIALQLVIIPAKARVYPEHLGALKLPAKRQKLYQDILTLCSADCLDSLTAFKDSKAASQLFLRTDTHWTPEGAEVIAKAISTKVSQMQLANSNFQTEKLADTKKHSGDLAKFSQTEKLKKLFPELYEPRNQYQTTNQSEGDLFGEATIPVALVGTSYSAQEKWNFTGFLQQALQADVINVADEGGGPVTPMRKFMKEVLPQNPELKLVIWEFPERFFPVDYSMKEEQK